MGAWQRRKGAAGEREFAKLLSDWLGVPVKRILGQARDGGHDIQARGCKFEVKRRKRIAMLRWFEQVERSAGDSAPVVAMREDNGEWFVTLRADKFIELLNRPDLQPKEERE